MEQIIIGCVRVQLLSDEIVRIEYGKDGKFCDKNTFFIPDRTGYASTRVAYKQEGNYIRFGAFELFVPENAESLAGVQLSKNGKSVYDYERIGNSGELPPLGETSEVFALSDTPRIFVPEGGYSVERKGEYVVEEDAEDIYLMLCDRNAKALRKLYVELTGRSTLVRLSALGGWNSKYYAYSEETAKQLILNYENYDVPLDVMVIDTDWRSCVRGWGYDTNTNLFPNMARFLDFAHSREIEIVFNDHPEPVDGAQVFAPEEIAYREKNLQTLLGLGLDTWWYDRNWGTSLVSPTENVRVQTFGLYLYEDITRNFYRKQANDDKIYRRPVIMGNVVHVQDGLYGAITDSGSHRYSVQWTGDCPSDAWSIAREIGNLIKGGNNAIPYVNADCGGHTGDPDKDLFIRWMQFGTLSPIFRPHCTTYVKKTREPWLYDEETLDIVREYNNLRYRLLPVIYKNAYANYETGEPIFRALGWEYPNDERALSREDEYMLGNDILIAPATESEKEVYLPEGKWLDVFEGKIYRGGTVLHRDCKDLRGMPLYVRLGALIPLAYNAKNTKRQKWDKLVFDFYPCKDATDSGYLYEDDGETTAYMYGQFRKSAFEAKYSEKDNGYVVTLVAARGSFRGDKCFANRNITIKYHLLDGAAVRGVTVNGEETAFRTVKKKPVFPLNAEECAPDSDVVCVTLNVSTDRDYKIVFRLK